MTDAERTQHIRDQMSIDLCRAVEILIDLAVDAASGQRLTARRVSDASTAQGRLKAHREILEDAVKD